jgi:hypothetical protein
MDDKRKAPEAETTSDKAAATTPDGAADAGTEAKTPGAKEIGGRGGPDPVRYGDWEKGGIAVDF